MNIKDLEDKYAGERIFIVGNGPSLDDTPLELLKNEYSIAMNGINDIYSETCWRPSFYVLLLDELERSYGEYLTDNLNSGIKCMTLSRHRPEFGNRTNICYMKKKKLKYNTVAGDQDFHELDIEDIQSLNISELYDFWPNKVSEYVYTYHSTYAVIQIAMYMGFEEIYLLGCDLGYGTYNPHMIFKKGLNPNRWDGDKNSYLLESYREGTLIKSVVNGIIFKILTSSIADLAGQILDYVNDLDNANRFNSHVQLQPEDLTHVNTEITKSHIAAQRIASDKGVDIYNATVGGELEVYPRVSLESMFNNQKQHESE